MLPLTVLALRRPLFHSLKSLAVKSHFSNPANTYSQSPPLTQYGAIVVGYGPAGIATVGNLLENGVKPILWVDKSFKAAGGRLNWKYREVPSNTKVKLFIQFSNVLEPFRQIVNKERISGAKPDTYTQLQGMDQEKGCQLQEAAMLCRQLFNGLKSRPDVHLWNLHLKRVVYKDGNWQIPRRLTAKEIASGDQTKTSGRSDAPILVLCTGAAPSAPVLSESFPKLIVTPLDAALSPTKLSSLIAKEKTLVIAVVGASHSAILVLQNLYNIASTTHPEMRIKWFSRHPLRYAEDRGDWILRDNTGLKGATAEWARVNLEPGTFEKSDVSKYITKIETGKGKQEEEAYQKHLPECRRIVEAVGFTAHPLPEVWVEGSEVVDGEKAISQLKDLKCDNTTGGFIHGSGEQVKGLYGAGIAFPERVVDPEGNVEYAVGMWKFMRYLRRVVPGWVGAQAKVE